jgi:hypothetical protein
MHRFDWLLFFRSLVLALLASAVAVAVAAATDEPSSSWPMRLARLTALLPALAALGGAVALGQAHVRGELRALSALGVSPFRLALGPMLAGWLLGALAVAMLLSPLADATSLFPKLAVAGGWVQRATELVQPDRGVSVAPDGQLTLSGVAAAPGTGFVPTGLAAAMVFGPLGLVLPVWLSARVAAAPRAAGVFCSAAFTILLLHATAAGRTSPFWLPVGALPVALQALVGHVWSRAGGPN